MGRQLEVLTDTDRNLIEKHGFVVHMVPGESVHTHGLTENYGQSEFECVLAMSPQTLAVLIEDLGERVKAGMSFSDGDVLTDLIRNFQARLVRTPNGLRLILPDPQGNLERDRMHPQYAYQYQGL